MPDVSRKRLRRTTFIYLLLLLYIVAALVWWFISLNKQNDMMRDFKITKLDFAINRNVTPSLYRAELNKTFEAVNAEMKTAMDSYNNETRFGMKKKEQQRWEESIQDKLADFSK